MVFGASPFLYHMYTDYSMLKWANFLLVHKNNILNIESLIFKSDYNINAPSA